MVLKKANLLRIVNFKYFLLILAAILSMTIIGIKTNHDYKERKTQEINRLYYQYDKQQQAERTLLIYHLTVELHLRETDKDFIEALRAFDSDTRAHKLSLITQIP